MSDKQEATAELLLDARNVTKIFPASKKRQLVANDHVSLRIYKGETLGIAGESGCGKSTFVRLLTGLERPTSGELFYRGQDLSKLSGEELRQSRKNIQMVFQDPSDAFYERMKLKKIVCEPLRNYGMIRKNEMDECAARLLEMVELPGDWINRYPWQLSGGQRQRVGIARGLALEPELLICDEATSALDVSIQKNVMELLVRLQKEKGISIAFICHDIALVRAMSHRVAIMYLGNIVEVVPSKAIGKEPVHPYTQALIDSVFSTKMDFEKPIDSIDSEIPSPLNLPSGCPFCSRCNFVMESCLKEKPILREVEPGHEMACHLYP